MSIIGAGCVKSFGVDLRIRAIFGSINFLTQICPPNQFHFGRDMLGARPAIYILGYWSWE
jgi:hypothetical protein